MIYNKICIVNTCFGIDFFLMKTGAKEKKETFYQMSLVEMSKCMGLTVVLISKLEQFTCYNDNYNQ